MPLVVVYNLSKKDLEDERRIAELEGVIWDVISNVPELELKSSDVSFSFPQDPTITSDEVTVIIIVELLFDKPKRTTEVRQRLAHGIANGFITIPGYKYRKVEVAIKRFNPEKDGFFSAG